MLWLALLREAQIYTLAGFLRSYLHNSDLCEAYGWLSLVKPGICAEKSKALLAKPCYG
jgi:hypothetical protein